MMLEMQFLGKGSKMAGLKPLSIIYFSYIVAISFYLVE